MRPRLIPEWKQVLRRAWSIKFMLLAGALSAGEVFLQITDTAAIPKGVFAALSGLVTTFAMVARVMAQHEAEQNAE